MEYYHYTTFRGLAEQAQRLSDELFFWPHAVHTVTEQDDVERLTMFIDHAIAVRFPAAVKRERIRIDISFSLQTG